MVCVAARDAVAGVMRTCAECRAPLIRGAAESFGRFAARVCCDAVCWSVYTRRSAEAAAADRFYSLVYPEPTSGCHLWVGVRLPNGYGQFSVAGVRWLAHRYAWGLARTVPPADLNVCHRCDTRACVNPGHLFLGTDSDNMQDCVRKGRFVDNSGERCGTAKLTIPQVLEIRMRLSRDESQRLIATDYGVTRSAIEAIAIGRTWRSV